MLPRCTARVATLCILLLMAAAQVCEASGVRFSSAEHGIYATIPDGWDQVQGLTEQTVLKIGRFWDDYQRARISVMLHQIRPGAVAPNYDIWTQTDEEIRQATAGGSMAGEVPTVLDIGRGLVDDLHMVWTKTRRTTPGDSTLWEFTYSGFRGSGTQFITIRLSVTGDEAWYGENQAVFAEFIRSMAISWGRSSP